MNAEPVSDGALLDKWRRVEAEINEDRMVVAQCRSDQSCSAAAQKPAEQPVLTGWFGGPKTQALAHLTQDTLVGMRLASLAGIFAVSLDYLRRMLATRGAYSYATPETWQAQMARSYSQAKPSIAALRWAQQRPRWPAD
jgi:hypothetical protein